MRLSVVVRQYSIIENSIKCGHKNWMDRVYTILCDRICLYTKGTRSLISTSITNVGLYSTTY